MLFSLLKKEILKVSNVGRSHYYIGKQKRGANRLNSVQKATNLKKKSKVGIHEMYSNC